MKIDREANCLRDSRTIKRMSVSVTTAFRLPRNDDESHDEWLEATARRAAIEIKHFNHHYVDGNNSERHWEAFLMLRRSLSRDDGCVDVRQADRAVQLSFKSKEKPSLIEETAKLVQPSN
jgi:hypothetical protein